MSATFWWNTSSDPISPLVPAPLAEVSAGTVGATATRTVTRTLASTVPPSPMATRWKLGEGGGETGGVPLGLTLPMPSMETALASVVRQLRTTDWPRSMASGSAVSVAVGAGAALGVVGPRLAGLGAVEFLWQPATAARAKANNSTARAESAARAEVVRMDCGCEERIPIIGFLLRKRDVSLVYVTENQSCRQRGFPARYLPSADDGPYFQLQFGISPPAPVSGRRWEPSESMVQIFMCSARPSAELA